MNKNLINYSITNTDIENYLMSPNIVKYGDISNMNDIDELFNGGCYVIILVESEENSGHWCLCLRYDDDIIEQFDSYGGKIDNEMKYISSDQKLKLNEENNELANILQGYKVVVSKYRFQKLDPNIDTCGKWTLLRILMFVLGHMEIDEFTQWFKKLAKEERCSNDELVCRLITF